MILYLIYVMFENDNMTITIYPIARFLFTSFAGSGKREGGQIFVAMCHICHCLEYLVLSVIITPSMVDFQISKFCGIRLRI